MKFTENFAGNFPKIRQTNKKSSQLHLPAFSELFFENLGGPRTPVWESCYPRMLQLQCHTAPIKSKVPVPVVRVLVKTGHSKNCCYTLSDRERRFGPKFSDRSFFLETRSSGNCLALSGHYSHFSFTGEWFPPYSARRLVFVHSHIHLAITGERFTHSYHWRECIHSMRIVATKVWLNCQESPRETPKIESGDNSKNLVEATGKMSKIADFCRLSLSRVPGLAFFPKPLPPMPLSVDQSFPLLQSLLHCPPGTRMW